MNFSLILPTRDRLGLFESLLDSLVKTTYDLEEIEMWCALDLDDRHMISHINRLSRQHLFLRFIIIERQNNFSEGYYNRLASISTGDYIMALNDDVVFLTKDWDKIALEELKKYQSTQPDDVVLGKANDQTGCGYCCFPILSRQAYEVAGWFFHPEQTTWYADINLNEIFHNLGRITDLSFKVEHVSHHTGKRERDDLNRRMESLARYNKGCALGESLRIGKIIKEMQPSKLMY